MRISWGGRRPGRAASLVLGLVMLAVGALAVEKAETAVAVGRDMVWADYEGQRRDIYFSTQAKDGAWSEPLRISDGKTDSLLPCIVNTAAGGKFVVWTVMEDARLGIRYAVFDGEEWSEPQLVPGMPRDATMPFVAADDAGVVWLVFVGNDGAGQDDIYCVRLQEGRWTKPERVNAPNEAPDIHPFIEIDRDGDIQVTWEGFRGDGYVPLTTRRRDGEWTAEEPLPQEDGEALEQNRKRFAEEQLPDFVRDRSMLFMRGGDQ